MGITAWEESYEIFCSIFLFFFVCFLFVGGFAWLMNVSYIRQSIIRCQADG